jgi:hypothetical protein
MAAHSPSCSIGSTDRSNIKRFVLQRERFRDLIGISNPISVSGAKPLSVW